MKTDATLTVFRTFDREPIATLERTPFETVDIWLDEMRVLHRGRAHFPAFRRRDILLRLADLMKAERNDLAMTIALEGGKPLIDAHIEADRAIHGVELAASEIERIAGRQVPMDLSPAGAERIAFTRREPIGPVVAISAFNHPLNLIVHQVAPAIATGCPVIVKPADPTPLSARRFVELAYEAGLPEEWCRLALLDIPDAEKLATDPRVAFLTFIGSAKVGWHLRSKLAPGTRCALEHGGAAPVILMPDADLDAAIPLLVKGGYYHSGQVCVSVQRIFAHASIADEVENRLTQAVADLVSGDPTREETEAGPLILPREVERVSDWVLEAEKAGARIAIGGQAISKTCYAPTVLVEPPEDSKVSTLEIFGPVTCLFRYTDVGEAVRRANALPVAFQAAVFGRDINRTLAVADRLDGSGIMINDHTAFRTDWMPFAGLRQSGLGTGGIG
ncbi:MAG: aldehyde dehydrogenase family protein [Nitratireductor sp.]|nr:aldehyde dehydrogenase family protein [Nitratireductor sp.]